jgi:hypothetical protein
MDGWSEIAGNAVYVMADSVERLGRDILAIASGRRQRTSSEDSIVTGFCGTSIAGQKSFSELVSLWGWTYNWIDVDGTVYYGVRLMPQSGKVVGAEGARNWEVQLEAWMDALQVEQIM